MQPPSCKSLKLQGLSQPFKQQHLQREHPRSSYTITQTSLKVQPTTFYRQKFHTKNLHSIRPFWSLPSGLGSFRRGSSKILSVSFHERPASAAESIPNFRNGITCLFVRIFYIRPFKKGATKKKRQLARPRNRQSLAAFSG